MYQKLFRIKYRNNNSAYDHRSVGGDFVRIETILTEFPVNHREKEYIMKKNLH